MFTLLTISVVDSSVVNHGVSFNRLADHIFISVPFDRLRMFLKMIHKKKAPGSESPWRACSSFSNYARDLAIILEFCLWCLWGGFLSFFQGLLHLKRTDTTLLFWSSLSTWVFVQRSRKMHPVHVLSGRHGAPAVCVQEAGGGLHM